MLECDDIIATQMLQAKLTRQLIPTLAIPPTSERSDARADSTEARIRTDVSSIREYLEEIFDSVKPEELEASLQQRQSKSPLELMCML
jgi:hypothetical protein